GIPMATDIAFALGVVALLGSRVPAPLKVFLLTLAIVDDIGAIVVIAVFYTDDLEPAWLVGAAGVAMGVWLMRRVELRAPAIYLVAGLVLWLCVFESGVHATIAGVVLGLLTPARPFMPEPAAEEIVDSLEQRQSLSAEDVREVSLRISDSVSVAERLEFALHPWVSFVVVPLFALANAGVRFTGSTLDAPRVALGILVGLVIGKPLGVAAFAWLATRLRIASLPQGVRWPQLIGVAVLAGIGFTVSLFITELAFEEHRVLEASAKAAILIASAIAAIAGAAALGLASRSARAEPPDPS
ncbi:MAG TPA: Na+/H+ antiporter NhaA, partial [Acidimicrobiales bacterium]